MFNQWRYWAVGLVLFSAQPALAGERAFQQINGPCNLRFPEAHRAHPGYQTEWWYYTGNLETGTGRPFGFQYTLFRRQIHPDSEPQANPAGKTSAWRSHQVYLGHAALADIEAKAHYQTERISRGAEFLAGVHPEGQSTRLQLLDWEGRITPQGHQLKVQGDGFAYRFELTPQKPPVLHGDRGYSRKGRTAERASCYYSLTRLKVSGEIQIGKELHTVQGTAWMDHEYSSAYLEPGLAGWDWFSLQLSDDTELMIFLLRHDDGKLSPASSGTYVDSRGRSRHLKRADFTLTSRDIWQSPRSGGRYPLGWTITLPFLDLHLEAEAAFPGQEMQTQATTGVTYWEGSIEANGTRAGRPVQGRGYLEMTGRTGKGFEAPL